MSGIATAVVVAGGLSMAGSAMQAGAAGDAASAQAASTASQVAEQRAAREQARQYLEPYYQQGLSYQNQLAGLMPSLTTPYTMDMYKQSPEYQNQLLATQQAQDAIMAQRAATGQAGGGGALLALQNAAQQQAQLGYGQGLSDYWSQNINMYNMLQPMVAAGQNAASGQGTNATNMANAIAQTMQTGTSAQNQYNMAGANAWASGLNSLGGSITGGLSAYNQNQQFNALLGKL